MAVYRIIILFFAGLLWFWSSVSAHNVSVFAWVTGDTVYVESKMSGGKRPKGAKIRVYNGRGDLLNEGITDHQGAYQFKLEHPTDLKIILNAGMGHRAEWLIKESELSDSKEAEPLGQSTKEKDTQVVRSDVVARQSQTTCLTTAEIDIIIDAALERKLAPVMKEIGQYRDSKPGIQDILGGLGYILGLVGLVAYVRYHKKSKPSGKNL